MAEIVKKTKTTAEMRIMNQGKLVYAEKSPIPKIWQKYHAWRCEWCTLHRNSWTPRGLREGNVNLVNLIFYLVRR
jgi:hypothetical protein